jgi:hypothetical protein
MFIGHRGCSSPAPDLDPEQKRRHESPRRAPPVAPLPRVLTHPEEPKRFQKVRKGRVVVEKLHNSHGLLLPRRDKFVRRQRTDSYVFGVEMRCLRTQQRREQRIRSANERAGIVGRAGRCCRISRLDCQRPERIRRYISGVSSRATKS